MQQDYAISTLKKVILLICTVVVIIVHMLYALMSHYSLGNLLTHVIIYSALILSYGFIFFTILEYFMCYKIKLLVFICAILFILMTGIEVFNLVSNIYHVYNTKISRILLSGLSILLIITFIVWIILMFRQKNSLGKAINSLLKFAILYILSIILSAMLAIVLDKTRYSEIIHFNEVFIGLAYIFIIEFVVRIKKVPVCKGKISC